MRPVSLLRFTSLSRLEGSDALAMSEALLQLVDGAGAAWPPAATALVSGARRALDSAVGAAAAGGGGGGAEGGGRRPPGAVLAVSTERLLDAAAALLDAAQLLHRHGDRLPAFAIEGVQGRLLEAVVGAGNVESIA